MALSARVPSGLFNPSTYSCIHSFCGGLGLYPALYQWTLERESRCSNASDVAGGLSWDASETRQRVRGSITSGVVEGHMLSTLIQTAA